MNPSNILHWLGENLPTFTSGLDKQARTHNVSKYSQICFIFTVILLCIIHPVWFHLSLKKSYFKLCHELRRYISTRQKWIHKLRIYHNRSLRLCVFWSIVICFFSTINNKNDLLIITKRLGRISAVLMPPLLFLTLRPSPLPNTLYLSLLPLHKWISRTMSMAALLHSVLYIYYMHIKGTLSVKIWKLANIYGVIVMILFVIIGITSVRQVRRKNFRLFYNIHYIFTWLSVLLMHFHARPSVSWYTLLNLIILMYQIVYRIKHTKKVKPSITKISPTLTLFEFSSKHLSHIPTLPSSHVRINIVSKNIWKRWFTLLVPLAHPFTILSLPTDDNVKLLIRNGNLPLYSDSEYYITGAFEPMISFIKKEKNPIDFHDTNPFRVMSAQLRLSPLYFRIDAKRVLICVGGSAITFGLPLLRILNFNGVNVKLIWVTRDYRDLKILNSFTNNFDGLEIYISKSDKTDVDIHLDYCDMDDDEDGMENSTFTLSDSTPPASIITEQSGLLANNSLACVNNINYDSTHQDEYDFTNSFENNDPSIINSNSKFSSQHIFREPLIVCPQSSCDRKICVSKSCPIDTRIKIPSTVKIFYGRPKLGDRCYRWCLQRECDSSNVQLEADSQCPDNSLKTEEDVLSQVWVMAAGPRGLVENTRCWATDCGLRFHAESFSV